MKYHIELKNGDRLASFQFKIDRDNLLADWLKRPNWRSYVAVDMEA